jgi:hypothetical protein
MPLRKYCKICRRLFKKRYLTQSKNGNYYCPKCLIDLYRKKIFSNEGEMKFIKGECEL